MQVWLKKHEFFSHIIIFLSPNMSMSSLHMPSSPSSARFPEEKVSLQVIPVESLGFHAPVFWFISPQRTFLFFSFWDTFLLSLSLGNILLSSAV